jgi:hypothetical protein
MRLDELVASVSEAIKRAEIDDVGLQIEQIDLSVQVTNAAGGGVELNVFEVIEVDGSVETESVQTLTLSLVPEELPPAEKIASFGPDLIEPLVAGIRAAAAGAKQAVSQMPDWVLKTATVEVDFTVSGGGGFKIVAKGSAKRTETQAVVLTLNGG